MKVENMIRILMSRLAPAAVICGVVLSQCLSAATLNVEFDVRTRAAESDPAYKRNSIAIFVLDRSESMTWRPANGEKAKDGWVARNRNQLLCESFQDRIRTMSENEPNTKVFVLEFSYDIKPLEGPFALNSPHDVERLLSWEGLKDVKCMGKTLLYDARERALEKAEEFYSKDPSVKVELFVYTDGDNDTPPSGYWRRKKLDENGKEQVDFWGNPIEERVEVRYSSRDNKTAKKKFDEKWAKKKAAYSESGKLELHWRWLGKGTPPPGIKNTRKDEYEMLLTSASRVLKSLSAMPEQKLGVELTVPIPSQYENSLNDLRATTVLEISGKRISSKFISLQPGKHTVTFQIPDDFGANAADGKLSIADVPDAWERMVLKPPAPLELTFAAPGKLSFLDIDPKDDFFVRKGSTKEFKAKATEDADIHWSWPGGSKTTNACPITFTTTTPDPLDVLVTAKKKGFLPVEEKIKVHVIDANVGVSVGTSRPMVGEAIEFLAKAHGQPESYSWKIDKQPMPGQDARLKVPVFSGGSGPHVVSVRAYYGHGIMADSGEVPFVVAAKPYIEIAEPDSGSEYPFGEKVECKANVEGDFDKVVWELEGPAGEKQESAVDKTAKASRPVFFKLAKGGKYTLKATAVGAAGSLPAKASVVLKVAYENLGISITSHASGTPVQLGRNAENLNLVAEVTGDKITKAKWFVRKESGEELEIRTTPVQRENGKRIAKCSFSPDPSTKDGSSLFVRAEAVFDGDAPSEPVVSPSIELIATRYAEIELEAKVNGGEANGREVRFGDQVDFRAKCNENIDANQVQWYISTNGVVREMGSVRGSQCTSPKEVPNGESLRTVRYFAVANLPDGSAVTSRVVVVHHHCPDIKCSIGLPRAGGVMRTSFGRAEAFDVQLEDENGRLLDTLTDVKWDFGDGVTADTPVFHRPAYGKYDEFTIKASGKCPKCGTRYYATPVKIKIEKQPAVAKFKMEPELSAYTIRGNIRLIDISEGDVGKRVWRVNGKEIQDSENKKEINDGLPSIPEDRTYTLEVTDMDGKASAPYVVTIRVRYGWLAVFFFIGAGLIIALAKKVLLGNDLLKMTVKTLIGPRPNGGLDDLLAAVIDPNVPEFSVKDYLNFWQKIVWMVVSKKPKSLTVPITELLSSDDEEAIRRFGDERLTFSVINDAPEVRYNERRFEYVTPMAWNHRSPYGEDDPSARIRVLRDRSCKDDSKSCLYLLMRLEDSLHWSVIAFWVIVITMIYLVFHLCMRYAI